MESNHIINNKITKSAVIVTEQRGWKMMNSKAERKQENKISFNSALFVNDNIIGKIY